MLLLVCRSIPDSSRRMISEMLQKVGSHKGRGHIQVECGGSDVARQQRSLSVQAQKCQEKSQFLCSQSFTKNA